MVLFSALSAASSIFGGFSKKKAAKREARAQAEAARFNASIVREQTATDLLVSGRQGIQSLGATRADIGGAGLTAGGSAADVLRQSARDIAFEQQTIQRQGDLQAQRFEMGATSALERGKRQGRAALIQGGFGAASSLLGGFSGGFGGGGGTRIPRAGGGF